MIFSFPLRSNGSKWEIVQGLDVDPFAREKINATLSELNEEREITKQLLG